MDYVDLFAGPGGWDVAARRLGLEGVGIEWDQAACDTRRAAGFPTQQGDVRNLSPTLFYTRGLIASPPCQTFSAAGNGAGRRALDLVLSEMDKVGLGRGKYRPDPEQFDDPRTALVLEPLWWVLEACAEARPYQWVAWEQVPAVLPVWEHAAVILMEHGYSVDTGLLHAEQYGVPQTRKRAVLVARLSGSVKLPNPTHSRYYPRNPAKLDPEVPGWISMAKALGFGASSRPSVTVSTKHGGIEGGSGGREAILKEFEGGRWLMGDVINKNGSVRSVDRPSPTLTSSMDNGNFRWTYNRHATTVAASFGANTIAGPGYRTTGGVSRQNAPGSVRVSVEEAAILQTFPEDYPWQGSKTKQYEQVGNAIPPLLAWHVLKAVVGEGRNGGDS